MIIKYYCDACKKEITDKYIKISVEEQCFYKNASGEKFPGMVQGPIIFAHLCLSCYNSLPLDGIKAHKTVVHSPNLAD